MQYESQGDIFIGFMNQQMWVKILRSCRVKAPLLEEVPESVSGVTRIVLFSIPPFLENLSPFNGMVNDSPV